MGLRLRVLVMKMMKLVMKMMKMVKVKRDLELMMWNRNGNRQRLALPLQLAPNKPREKSLELDELDEEERNHLSPPPLCPPGFGSKHPRPRFAALMRLRDSLRG